MLMENVKDVMTKIEINGDGMPWHEWFISEWTVFPTQGWYKQPLQRSHTKKTKALRRLKHILPGTIFLLGKPTLIRLLFRKSFDYAILSTTILTWLSSYIYYVCMVLAKGIRYTMLDPFHRWGANHINYIWVLVDFVC